MYFNTNSLLIGLHHIITMFTPNNKNKPGSNKQRHYAEKENT